MGWVGQCHHCLCLKMCGLFFLPPHLHCCCVPLFYLLTSLIKHFLWAIFLPRPRHMAPIGDRVKSKTFFKTFFGIWHCFIITCLAWMPD